MAVVTNKRIVELTEATSINSNMFLPVDDASGETKKLSIGKLASVNDLVSKADMFRLSPQKGVTYDITVPNRFGLSGLLFTRNNGGNALYFCPAGFTISQCIYGEEGGEITVYGGDHVRYKQNHSSSGTFIFIGFIDVAPTVTVVEE